MLPSLKAKIIKKKADKIANHDFGMAAIPSRTKCVALLKKKNVNSRYAML